VLPLVVRWPVGQLGQAVLLAVSREMLRWCGVTNPRVLDDRYTRM